MSESEPEEPGNGTGIDDLLHPLPEPDDDGDDITAEQEEVPGNDDDVDHLFDVLSSPLDDGSGITAVLTRRPRAKLPSLTLVLAAIVVASAGFLGGALVGKHYGSSGSSAAAAFSRFAGARASASTGAGSGSSASGRTGAFGAGNATVGTIKLIDGSTVYVQTTAG